MKPKDISREEYVKEFCRDRRIRDRRVVYIDSGTHRKLKRITHLFSDEYQTVASLADAIITHHIDTYRALLNRLDEEANREMMEWLSGLGKSADETEDETEDEPV